MRAAFTEIGDAQASTVRANSPHPLMHRTESIDYGVVISGEMTLVLDKGEALLREGDVVVQRGTNHAWANRSGKPCRMLFVLVDGRFEPGNSWRDGGLMKFATYDDDSIDGRLVVVSGDRARAVDASAIAPNLLIALQQLARGRKRR